jgi:hypothetical protein
VNVLGCIKRYSADLESLGTQAPPAPRWNQDWFPRLDAAAAYAVVRASRPRRIVEVGSGHSTRFLARAVADEGLATRITAIDPQPRASLAGLAVEWLQCPVQSLPPERFVELERDDILFIDSSHQRRPGSDVEFLMDEVLPRLRNGVRVHFHDIFLPDPYPAAWDWRRYNEQQSVAELPARGYAVEFSSHDVVRRGELPGVLARVPTPPGALESSLWLLKH